jgi:DNA-binding XRE family transcriptional regulator
MSQSVMAAFLNVPKRTLESWEQGRRTPKAGEARLLQLCESAPKQFEAMVIALGVARGRARRASSRSAA